MQALTSPQQRTIYVVNSTTDVGPSVAIPRHHRTLWWKEVLIISSFYAVYTLIRNQFGSAAVVEGDGEDQVAGEAIASGGDHGSQQRGRDELDGDPDLGDEGRKPVFA